MSEGQFDCIPIEMGIWVTRLYRKLRANLKIGIQHPEHKESFMDKILHHHHHPNENESESSHLKDKPHEGEGGFHADLKKEEDKFKNYIKEDKKLEEEGQEYGGLM